MSTVRTLHPLAWWGWGASLAIATSRTTNLWLLSAIIVAAMVVTFSRRSRDPWASAITIGIKVACIALVLRMIIAIVFSVPGQGKVVFTLPRVKLPEWLAGILLGGNVTWERLHSVFLESLTIFALVVAIASASSLSNPKEMLRSLPGILHEAGVALIIATTLIPHFAMSLRRIREARRMRGDTERFGFKKTLVPLFEEALERALILAESMEARGYGHRATKRPSALPTLLLLAGLGLLFYSVLQLVLGYEYRITLTGSIVLIVAGLWIANKKTIRSKYRPIPWRIRESFVLLTALVTIGIVQLTFTPLVLGALFLLAATPLLVTRRELAVT